MYLRRRCVYLWAPLVGSVALHLPPARVRFFVSMGIRNTNDIYAMMPDQMRTSQAYNLLKNEICCYSSDRRRPCRACCAQNTTYQVLDLAPGQKLLVTVELLCSGFRAHNQICNKETFAMVWPIVVIGLIAGKIGSFNKASTPVGPSGHFHARHFCAFASNSHRVEIHFSKQQLPFFAE